MPKELSEYELGEGEGDIWKSPVNDDMSSIGNDSSGAVIGIVLEYKFASSYANPLARLLKL